MYSYEILQIYEYGFKKYSISHNSTFSIIPIRNSHCLLLVFYFSVSTCIMYERGYDVSSFVILSAFWYF